jgi:orotidine-5'-phosphate decarboxylase
LDDARELVRELGAEVVFYKVGLGLQLAGGDRFAAELKESGKKVFLDYKYYDIEETIKNAVARAAEIGIDFLTVHGVSGILRSAVAGRGTSAMKILCVTVLTSMDAHDLEEMGFPSTMTVEELVVHRAVNAMRLGVDGVIASAREAKRIKEQTGGGIMIVTPAIRPTGAAVNDQKRSATPFEAIRAGADILSLDVLSRGRKILNRPQPRSFAKWRTHLVPSDLPLKFHPAAIRASAGFTPWGAGGATCDRRSWLGLRRRSRVAERLAA